MYFIGFVYKQKPIESNLRRPQNGILRCVRVGVWMPMSDAELEKLDSQEIWVDLFEAAELTGFNLESMRKLAYRIAQQPEAEREINIRKRTSRWEVWLPDLLAYVKRPTHGPRPKRDNKDST